MTICVPPGTDWSCAYTEDELTAMRADPVTLAKMERSEALAWMQLAALTADQLGTCPITVRPCKAGCRDGAPVYLTAPVPADGMYAGLPGRSSFYPHIGTGGMWVNSCGCTSDCSCTSLCEAILPGPVGEIVEVLLDGAVLDSRAYRVDNGNRLVRVDGDCWPACQDMTLPGQPQYEPAVIENPTNTITVTRQGQIVQIVVEPTELIQGGNFAGQLPYTVRGGSQTNIYNSSGGQIGTFVLSGGAKNMGGSAGPGFEAFRIIYETTDAPAPNEAAGTFIVTYYQGAAPDELSKWMAGLLAVEYFKACTQDKSCRLPSRLQQLTRQGVSYQIAFADDDTTGIREIDDFVRRLNPYHLKMAPVIVSPQSRRPRQPTVGRF